MLGVTIYILLRVCLTKAHLNFLNSLAWFGFWNRSSLICLPSFGIVSARFGRTDLLGVENAKWWQMNQVGSWLGM